MISYNRSSRETCQKIYDGLIARNYKVWMDLADMGDDILVSMARAVEILILYFFVLINNIMKVIIVD